MSRRNIAALEEDLALGRLEEAKAEHPRSSVVLPAPVGPEVAQDLARPKRPKLTF